MILTLLYIITFIRQKVSLETIITFNPIKFYGPSKNNKVLFILFNIFSIFIQFRSKSFTIMKLSFVLLIVTRKLKCYSIL